MNLPFEPPLDPPDEVPSYILKVEIVVTAWNPDQAIDYLGDVLAKSKRESDCEIFDWDVQSWEEA